MTDVPSLLRLRGRAARLLARLPVGMQRALALGKPIHVDGQTLDPTLQLFLRLRPPRDCPLTHGSPEDARRRHRHEVLSVRRPAATPVGNARDLVIAGAAGPLRARHYAPAALRGEPTLLVYFHGGGFALGDLDTLDEPCRLLCAHAGQHVLSVDYRLAPEHPFPAAADDALAAFRWAQRHAVEFGVAAQRIAVGGDSAGGNLAAVVARDAAIDRPPLAQLLVYPTLDRTRAHGSTALFDGFFLSREDCDAFARWYYEDAGFDAAEPRISPLAATSHSGLAPALCVTAGFDVLRDEAEAYARMLEAAGVRVTAYREPSLVHGFMQLTDASRACREAALRLADRWAALVLAVRPS
jgi:acetyl esterase